MVRASLSTLVRTARKHDSAKSATWRAERARDGSVLIYHDQHVLMRVWPDNRIDSLGNWRRTRADWRGVQAILLSVSNS